MLQELIQLTEIALGSLLGDGHSGLPEMAHFPEVGIGQE